MQLTGRLLVACALVAAGQLLVIGLHRGTDPTPAVLPQVGPDALPEEVAGFHGTDKPIDLRLVAASNADIMLNRLYENRLGDSVIVNVGIWTNYDRGIPHCPSECYPSAGWEISNRQRTTNTIEGLNPLTTLNYLFQRDTNQILVTVWVRMGDETVVSSEEVRPVLQRLRQTGGQLPPLIKVMLQTDARDPEQAQVRLNRFVTAIAPYIHDIR